MKAIGILLPVFIMMFLGGLSRKKQWISVEQKEGAKKIVFRILFPALIFHVIFTSDLAANFVHQILYLDIAWLIIFMIGKRLSGRIAEPYRTIAPYLLMTCEGGNVALPLYITIAGAAYAIHIVTFDVAGIIINFGIVPILVARESSSATSVKGLLKNIITNSFVIAVVVGLILNLTGLYGWLVASSFRSVYTNTMTMILAPITGIILFTLGYDFKIELKTLSALLRLTVIRLLGCVLIIAGFFLIFPGKMSDCYFRTAVLLYFMCPTGFPVPLQLTPLCKEEGQEQFMSAFISLYMIIAMIAYVVLILYQP